MEFLKILGWCVGYAVLYGIAHDLVTAHVCVEYFTIGHPPVFPTASPFWLALGWGVIATWWMGAALGLMLALAARVGGWPKLAWRELRLGVWIVLGVMGLLAVIVGFAAAAAAQANALWLIEPMKSRVPADRHVAFLGVGGAHLASYGAGAVGGLIVTGITLVRRAFRGGRASAGDRPAAE